jgi:hypothetical protein
MVAEPLYTKWKKPFTKTAYSTRMNILENERQKAGPWWPGAGGGQSLDYQ